MIQMEETPSVSCGNHKHLSPVSSRYIHYNKFSVYLKSFTVAGKSPKLVGSHGNSWNFKMENFRAWDLGKGT